MLNSHEWIDKISDALFAPEERRINLMIEELNQKNSAIKRKQLHGFMHLGERYVPESCKLQVTANRQQRIPMPTLAFELGDEASVFISDVKKIKLDKSQIRQVLFKLLHQVNSLQELRDALPEALVPLVPEIAQLSRCSETINLIRNDWRALRDYEKILPKIEMYAMTRLIY